MSPSRRSVPWLGCLLVLGMHALAPPVDASGTQRVSTLEKNALALESELIAPCCFTQTVANHWSPQAEAIKREIRASLAQGWSEDRIVDAYVEKYGERILAAPRASGFGMMAYLVPPLFVGLGAVVMGLWIRAHRADPSQRAVSRELRQNP